MKKKSDLPGLLEKEKAVPKAVAALIRSLEARRSFSQNGKTVTEPDFATQTKAALGLLAWSASPPPKVSAQDEPLEPLTEDQLVAEARRIHGMAPPELKP